MIVHELSGCAPAPLAHYLKALGVLRLVSEQVDAEARGWWEGERFFLATTLQRADIEEFFLRHYRPTPLVAPWNKGSGFFYADDGGLSPLERSRATRFAALRIGIASARAPLEALASADRSVRVIKAESTNRRLTPAQKKTLRDSSEYKKRLVEAEKRFKTLKAELVPRLRLDWRGPHREWMDSAMVLGDDGIAQFPALLGTGGNDGRLDFTNNYFQRLAELFDVGSADGCPTSTALSAFRGALWGQPEQSIRLGFASGQFLPGLAGGANSSNAPDGESGINSADFVLMLEGAILFTAHSSRRLGTVAPSRAAAPFAVSAHGAGYASASDDDESARGEQWMPLWSQPLTLPELSRLLAEGRAQIGARNAQEPLDLARAVARLGVARGIVAFQRYGYIERNGQSNLAVPLGRVHVPEHSVSRIACLDDLEAWLPRLRLQARDTKTRKAPASLKQAEKRLSNELFAVVQHPSEAARWQAVLLALTGVESVLRRGVGLRAGPIPPLRPEWITAADDGTPEFRLAVALALQSAGHSRDGRPERPVRFHWLPLHASGRRFAASGKGGQQRLLTGPEVVMQGRNAEDDAIALVSRRLIEAQQQGQRCLPLQAAPRTAAAPSDLARLIAGEVRLDHVLKLAYALMAIDSRQWFTSALRPAPAPRGEQPDDAWIAIRLALLPWPLPDGRRIGADPAILRRLAGGDAASALDLALRRLRSAGIQTALRAGSTDAAIAHRWAAALAFPITADTAAALLKRIQTSSPEKTP